MLKKIYKVLKNPEIDFEVGWLKDKRPNRKPLILHGIYEGDRIVINVFELILDTIIHECLHDIFENKTERQIEKLTDKIYNNLTERQKRHIFKLFGQRILEGGIK